MPRRVLYRKQLLKAVEAFLEATPSSYAEAQRVIQRCYTAIYHETKHLTLDQIIWASVITPLTDSGYYENQEFLHRTHAMLLGHSVSDVARTVFRDDCRAYFTPDEMEWYTQLLRMLDFLAAIPFTRMHEATAQARHKQESWESMRETIPEVRQAEEVEEEYQRRKRMLEAIVARCPVQESFGDEKMYRVALHDVTAVLTGMNVSKAAVYCGYPVLSSPYSIYGPSIVAASGLKLDVIDMSEAMKWSRRVLDALAGNGELFFSWRLGKARTFNADAFVISWH